MCWRLSHLLQQSHCRWLCSSTLLLLLLLLLLLHETHAASSTYAAAADARMCGIAA
jgi:hypothetical protein